MSDATYVNSLMKLKAFLSEKFVGREREILATIAGLVTGEPVILVGPPGTAKTKLIELTAKAINAKYFYYLLTRFTEPDEIIGPVDIVALRKGKYTRITTDRLPESHIVFLDEIFRSSSAIRNTLLDIILYKRVYIGTSYIPIKMLAFYTASNEVNIEPEDQAFYDRITIRNFHTFVSMDLWGNLIEKGVQLLRNSENVPLIMNVDELRKIQENVYEKSVETVKNSTWMNKYLELLAELKSNGIELTDRRKIKTVVVAAGISQIYGEEIVSLDSLADAIRFTAVSNEDDAKKVEESIIKVGLSSFEYRIRQMQTLQAELKNLMKRVGSIPADANLRALEDAVQKTATILEKTQDVARLKEYREVLEKTFIEASQLLNRMKAQRVENGSG